MNAKKLAISAIDLQTRARLPAETCPDSRAAFSTVAMDRLLPNMARAGMPMPSDPEAMFDLITHTHFLFRWLGCGLPVFLPTEDLLASLALTDCDRIQLCDVRMPFSAFLLDLRYAAWQLEDVLSNKHRIGCVMVHKYVQAPAAVLRPDGSAVINETRKIEKPMVLLAAKAGATYVSSTAFDSSTIEQVTAADYRDRRIPLTIEDRAAMKVFWRLALNLCLYINDKGRGTRQKRYTTKRSKRSRNATAPVPEVWVLGREIRVGSDIKAAARACIANRAQWRVQSRFTVRGHWRMQACGPNHSERKRTWIRPHWKGPKDGERIAHLYGCEESTPA